ncbi:hypothetical protein SAMD00019534_066960 [Acytostelium subglobosum LB1]|uniref:hypothetical protein n=1 Tax=Acytostelium subglobosum LB1 TaxID=1410327 RepID=UPI000644A75D|nr:hypothetical protein SAMD00019534_066960 [Acytostelium subglobosum LB1]GAM23521.1 hypothetical protein SAMD00019534_066960 [Acytostelium subglobosum LB1]|eukprot:XP_012753262.1 hypothetical protein SAMD00019534_066960 [Acytostelium subglobosum LB1]
MLRYNATDMFIKGFDSVSSGYPINDRLLMSASHMNNTEACDHLINKRPRTFYSIERTDSPGYVKHGNVHILQSCLNLMVHSSFAKGMVSVLPLAVDSGNLDFVRLLLKHLPINEDSNSLLTDNDNDNDIKFKRRGGISVDMLKVLHEEFNCLFVLTKLWKAILSRSVHCNMLGSVQYILDSMPSPKFQQLLSSDDHPNDMSYYWLLWRCAKNDNIAMFDALFNIRLVDQNDRMDIRATINEAADSSHESFIKHLYKYHVGNGHITRICEELLRDLLVMGQDLDILDVDQAKLLITPLAAIRNNDLESFKSATIKQNYNLDAETCRTMTKSMALLISNPLKGVEYNHNNKSLINMVRAVGKPGSNITADIVCQFIVNNNVHRPKKLNDTMKSAAGYSADERRMSRDNVIDIPTH